MILKYAVSGTHGSGKTTLVRLVAAKALASDWNVGVVSSPTRDIKKLGADYGMANNRDGDWQFQWQVIAETRRRAWEAEAHAKTVQENNIIGQPFLILGDRSMMDPVCYSADLLGRQTTGGMSVFMEPHDTQAMRSVYLLGKHLAMTDTFWDKLAYKPPHPDYLTADADRLDDRSYQLDIDNQFRNHFIELVEHHGSDKSVLVLTVDRDEAADQLWETITNDYARRSAAQGDQRSDSPAAG